MVKKTGNKEYEEELGISYQEPLETRVDGIAPREIEDAIRDIAGGLSEFFSHELVPKEALCMQRRTKLAREKIFGEY